jgi:hypothetical protein
MYIQLLGLSFKDICTVKKRLAIFPSPAGMSLTKLSLAGNYLIIPESVVGDIPAGDGKMDKIFYSAMAVLTSWKESRKRAPVPGAQVHPLAVPPGVQVQVADGNAHLGQPLGHAHQRLLVGGAGGGVVVVVGTVVRPVPQVVRHKVIAQGLLSCLLNRFTGFC